MTWSLVFRIFNIIRQHSILCAFKNSCFGKSRTYCWKKNTKSKIGSTGFNLIKKWFKLVSAIFLSFFYFFTKKKPFKNYEKCFLFHLKSSFHSRDIQIFVIFSLPLHSFQIQKDKWKWKNLWSHQLTCINLQM